jgi:hypothetical protein
VYVQIQLSVSNALDSLQQAVESMGTPRQPDKDELDEMITRLGCNECDCDTVRWGPPQSPELTPASSAAEPSTFMGTTLAVTS